MKKLFKLRDFKYSSKRIRPILKVISGTNLYNSLSFLSTDRRPACVYMKKFVLSCIPLDKRKEEFLKETTLIAAYATTGTKKRGIIRESKGSFSRQASRRSHVFFEISGDI